MALILPSLAASAEFDIKAEYADRVKFVELDESDCIAKEGKLIALQLVTSNTDMALYEVWIDRWFMDVQTADHTRQVLQAGKDPLPLGCSNTYSGKQYWTIYSVKLLK
ncbi:MAG: hypothetical protein HOP04_14050 [Methylophilaceae bacterium]|nr:hypothetical protein [Methylophilaceae bacterium]